jgi:soluble lytic murein transglycosylase-like protein
VRALLLALLLSSPASAAGLWAYVDDSGELVVSDRPDDPRAQPYVPGVGFAKRTEPKPQAGPARVPNVPYREILVRAAREAGIPLSLLVAVASAESGFNPRAESHAGARGVMQLMPETAKELGVKDVWDPAENIPAGARYLARLLKQFNDTTLAVAAYNAGPSRVAAVGRVPNITETQVYVKRVLSLERAYRLGL